MKKLFSTLIILICALVFPLAGCGAKNDSIFPSDDLTNDTKRVVVYFSTTGNTAEVAEEIADEIDADLFRIVPKTDYPSNYNAKLEVAREEVNNDSRPEIKNSLSTSKYETIFIGFPIWLDNIPNIIKTFIENSALSGKTIIPFCTHGGSGIDHALVTLHNLLPDNQFSQSLAIENGTSKEAMEAAVENWLDQIL